MDNLTKEQRSRLMSKIGSVSALERAARKRAEELADCRLIHQPKKLPGRPDYANKSRRVAVFIHGCYWHRPCPNGCAKPVKTNEEFWDTKFKANAERHKRAEEALAAMGFRVLVIWEHDLKEEAKRIRAAARRRAAPRKGRKTKRRRKSK